MHHQNPYFVFITDRSGRPILSYKSVLLLGFLILLCWAGSAQVVQDSTDFSTEVIQVVKSYAPEISDAFKMKQLPDFDEGPSASEIKLTYALLSVPVATDFVINLPNALPFKSVSGEKPFDCAHCGKSIKQPQEIKSHARSHTGEKPFLCSLCLKSFFQYGNMRSHNVTHTKEKKYDCLQCRMSYSR